LKEVQESLEQIESVAVDESDAVLGLDWRD